MFTAHNAISELKRLGHVKVTVIVVVILVLLCGVIVLYSWEDTCDPTNPDRASYCRAFGDFKNYAPRFPSVFTSACPECDCSRADLPDCNGNGVPVRGAEPWCSCHWGWTGDDCSVADNREPRKALIYLAYGDRNGINTGTLNYLGEVEAAVKGVNMNLRANFSMDIVVIWGGINVPNPATFPSFKAIEAASPRFPVKFVEVVLDFPDSLRDEFTQHKPTGGGCARLPWSLNYLHMCRFFENTVFKLPALAEYDFIWRMDSDLYMAGPYPCDPFEVFIKSEGIFGFVAGSNGETAECQGPIKTRCFEYAKENNFSPDHLHYMFPPNMTTYSGAFGMFKWSFFSSPQFLSFVDWLDGFGLPYRHRMGEQVFLVNALGLFIPQSAIWQFGSFGKWEHKWHGSGAIFCVKGPNAIDKYCPIPKAYDQCG